jgi:Mg-chelatase subunit ChlD
MASELYISRFLDIIMFFIILGDALQEALNIFQLPNVNGNFDKKLVILITDGAPNGIFTLRDDRFAQLNGADPWLVANEFDRQGIILAVVGVEPSIAECDDFYCALARKTGIQKLIN